MSSSNGGQAAALAGEAVPTAQELQADLSSLSRVSHRLAMIDNANTQQFDAVVAKLLPKLLVRLGRNHQQQQQQQQAQALLLQQIQAKLMEIFSHVLKRVKQRTNTPGAAKDKATATTTMDPLPCRAIVDLLVVLPPVVDEDAIAAAAGSSNHSSSASTNTFELRLGVDALMKNLCFTFLTVGVPVSANPSSLLPPLLVLLHHERASAPQSTLSSAAAAATLTLLVLQSLLSLQQQNNNNNNSSSSSLLLKQIRRFLQQRDELAAILYELLLDVLLWTPTAAPAAPGGVSVPPAGLSQRGHERLQSVVAAGVLPGTGGLSETKLALVELIAPARKALFLGGDNNNHHHHHKGVARTWVLLGVAKHGGTAERAQTYWQMYQKQQQQQQTEKDAERSSNSGLVIMELLSLTMGQAQAEATTLQNNNNNKDTVALPLHCQQLLDNNSSSTTTATAEVWAHKRRAVDWTLAATLWTLVASQIENEVAGSAAGTAASMVLFLTQKHLTACPSAMSLQQAKPFVALAQVMNAVVVRVLLLSSDNSDKDSSDTAAQFLEVCTQVLKRQVTTATAAASSSTTSSMSALNSEGSWAVREECYAVICHWCRSSSSSSADAAALMETATLLFACAAKEHERLRPRAVAALDALLEALVRIYAAPNPSSSRSNNASEEVVPMDVDANPVVANPWATTTTTTIAGPSKQKQPDDGKNAAAASIAKPLVPLLWNASQPHQPKACRVAAARWAAELLKKNHQQLGSLVQGCHLLCFLAGDSDVTAASIARQGLFAAKDGTDDYDDDPSSGADSLERLNRAGRSETEEKDGAEAPPLFPEFASFVEVVFPPLQGSQSTTTTTTTTRVQQYWEFSFGGKAAALKFTLKCLMADLYGGDDDQNATTRYLLALVQTLAHAAQETSSSNGNSSTNNNGTGKIDRTLMDLLDQTCASLLTTLQNSSYARRALVASQITAGYGLTLAEIQDLVLVGKSSKARRHLAGVMGVLYEEDDDDTLVRSRDGDVAASFSSWAQATGVGDALKVCVQNLSHLEKSHLGLPLGKLHGTIFLSGQILRAIQHRLLRLLQKMQDAESSDPDTKFINDTMKQCARMLRLLGTGVLSKEEVLGNASVDAIRIAFSFDTLDAPPPPQLDSESSSSWRTGISAVLGKMATAIRMFSNDGDAMDATRTMGLVRAAGTVLGATSLSVDGNSDDLHKARHLCVEAMFNTLGSMAFRKDDEVALVVGEALGKYGDSCNYKSIGLVDEVEEDFREDFSLGLPPHEYVLYRLLTQTLRASSPHKRTSAAPALLGLVGRAARLVHLNEENANRSFVVAAQSLLGRLQGAFITLLADPKIRHFSRESCCLGLAACRGLATSVAAVNDSGGGTAAADGLNQRLLHAFGQTANHGGSAYQETSTQAAERRAAQRENGSGNNNADQQNGGILEPFGMESEVGGAAGMGEAALGAYREMAAASIALGRPDILYALLILSISHSAWFVGSTKDKYSATMLLGESSSLGRGLRTNTAEFRQALRPHLGKLLPRILRACNDPNKQTRDQMGVLLAGLTGGGAETRDAITEHFLITVDILMQDASNKLWRARAGAIGALADLIVGRDWGSFGGGAPVLTDDDMYDDQNTTKAGVRLLRLWRVVVRSLDDVRDTVRTNGERLGRALRSLTIRLCDPRIVETSSGKQMTAEEKAQWARDASAASATSLRWLVKHGLNQTVADTQGLCISTLVELIAIAKPVIIEPSIPDVLRSLLMAMSGLEPAALNYVQLRTDNQEGLERWRLQLAQSGPLAKAITKCVDLLPDANPSIQRRVVTELDASLRLSVGFATRAAVADTASMMCNTCPGAFSFPGMSGNANPSVRLMRAFYFAAERERGQGAKDKMIHALGNIAALCPGGSVRSLSVRACKRYKACTGNNDDPASRRAAAAALRAIAVRASNQMSEGGSSDVWSQTVLPVAFLGQKDSDKKTASLMKEVWGEEGDAMESTVRYGTSREEQLLPGLVKECSEALEDVAWARRIAGAKAFEELCDLGVLGPAARAASATSIPLKSMDLERSRRRAEACHRAVSECTKVVLKPRLWSGKSIVVTALSKLACKWTAALATPGEEASLLGWDGEHGKCPWVPVSMEMVQDSNDLFVRDGWFNASPMDTDEHDDEKVNEKNDTDKSLDIRMEETNEENIDFNDMGEEEDEGITDGAKEGKEEIMNEEQRVDSTLSFLGLCRLLVREALPEKKVAAYDLSEEYLPYRSACLKAVHDLLKSLPPSDAHHRSVVFGKVGSILLDPLRVEEGSKKEKENDKEPPVVVSHAINCLAECLWEGFGSTDSMVEVVDPMSLCMLLRDVSGKLQPAWTVRQSGALGLARLVAVCDARFLRSSSSSRVIGTCVDCATYACRDKKFWRVREAGLRLVGALVRRAGPSSVQRDNLLLEALLPHKEDMLRLLRGSLSDSEPAITALSSETLPLLSWWP